MEVVSSILTTAFLAGGVLALAALGEVLTERVGVVNLGIEGVMSIGALSGIAAVFLVPNPYVGVAAALAVGALFGMVFATATVIVRANQILCGLALTLMGSGLAAALGGPYSGIPAPATFEPAPIPLLSGIPVLGKALFSQSVPVYLTFCVLPLALHLLLFKTRHGVNMRSVGENPAAADAAGIPVQAIRFWYVAAGSALMAGAGAYLTLAFISSYSAGAVAGRGWIAFALVIFSGYRPLGAVLGALLFGFIMALGFVGQARNWPIAAPVLSMLPYLGTLALIVIPAVAFPQVRRMLAAPAGLGQPFRRELR